MRKVKRACGAAAFLLTLAALPALGASDSAGSRGLAVVEKNRFNAILVGVDEYGTPSLETLSYAEADARKLRAALLKMGAPEENVRLLTSRGGVRERPSRETIMTALDEALKESGPDSTVLVALSGHGFETRDGEAAFCPEDAKVRVVNGEIFVDKSSAILISEVVEKLQMDDAKFKLLIVDACRAPAGARNAKGKGRAFDAIEASGVAFFQSCSSGESSWEDESVQGGLFTHYFVEGLNGAAKDEEGGVSFLGVCDYATRRTKARARALRNASQTPFYRIAGSNFYLLEPSEMSGDDEVAKLKRANELCLEAMKAYDLKDYSTARTKCKASLSEARTEIALALLGKIDAEERLKRALANADDVSWDSEPKEATRKSFLAGGLEYAFRYCPAGSFMMGTPESEEGRDSNEGPQHKVELTNGFWMLETEVTQEMWQSVLRGNPSFFSETGPADGREKVVGIDTSKFPVENVTWEGCQEFVRKLASDPDNHLELPDGWVLRLPTEAEWEYACRAGTTGPYAGEHLGDLGWVQMNSSARTHAVGELEPNPWGLYDMHGNVAEFCLDCYKDGYSADARTNPMNRVVRGGHWFRGDSYSRSGARGESLWGDDFGCAWFGFRFVVARKLPDEKE